MILINDSCKFKYQDIIRDVEDSNTIDCWRIESKKKVRWNPFELIMLDGTYMY